MGSLILEVLQCTEDYLISGKVNDAIEMHSRHVTGSFGIIERLRYE